MFHNRISIFSGIFTVSAFFALSVAQIGNRYRYHSGKSLCPENNGVTQNPFLEIQLRELNYYNRLDKRCYKSLTRGPCGINEMWVQQSPGSAFGMCTCHYSILDTGESGKLRDTCHQYEKFNRPLARSLKSSKCYPVFEQGDCKIGEWFTVNSRYEGICNRNPCQHLTNVSVSSKQYWDVLRFMNMDFYLESSDALQKSLKEFPAGVHPYQINRPIWYLHGGKCYKTFTQGHCQHSSQTALFKGVKSEPDCINIFNSQQCSLRAGVFVGGGRPLCPFDFARHGSDCVPKSSFRTEIEED